jgi:tRNA A-37 threonylcarbamoyl transferase component Bud32
MPCENPKCITTLNNKNISNYSEVENVFCEFQKCKKKFCNYKCLQIHFLEEHNYDNKKYFNYIDLNLDQKKLLKKTIEKSICGIYLEETLTEHKKRIFNDLNDLINTQNLQIKFKEIENDYNNLDYFYYFNIKNFDNPQSTQNFSSSLNKTGNFSNTTDISSISNNENNVNNNSSKKRNEFSKHFTKIIGSGAFGDVFLVKNSIDGKLFAIKQLNREKIRENGINNEIVYREINTHFKLIHNNIARLYDYHEDKKAFYLILEYIENGTLFNKIQKSNGLPEERALKYFIQVSSAIFFLHENQLIHRDIKPENCLIDKNDNVKLCDFGWTVEISKGERITFCGTYEYMAPEIIKEVPYNHMIDIWSLGVLLYELIHSFSPFRVQ